MEITYIPITSKSLYHMEFSFLFSAASADSKMKKNDIGFKN